MICPAVFRTNNGSSEVHPPTIHRPHDDIVNEVPVFRTRMLPGRLEAVFLLKKSIRHHQIVLGTESKEPNSICVHITNAVVSKNSLPGQMISTNSSVKVPEENYTVLFWDVQENAL